jgi:hypothetical protein
VQVTGQLDVPAALFPGNEPRLPFGQEGVWVQKSVWTRWWRKRFLPYSASRSVLLSASHVVTEFSRWLYQILAGRQRFELFFFLFFQHGIPFDALQHLIPFSRTAIRLYIYIISQHIAIGPLCQFRGELSHRLSVAWLGGTRPHKMLCSTVAARGAETWLIDTRVWKEVSEVHRLKVFENWVLGRISGPTRHKMAQ